jgi:hypothetical protein
MKRVIEIVLMLCGVLFLIELGILGWFYVVDPLDMFEAGSVAELKTMVTESATTNTSETSSVESAVGSPSQAQVEAAAAVGVEIPAFTEAQLQCFVGIFGEARVTEIKNGAVPTALEMYKGKSCL